MRPKSILALAVALAAPAAAQSTDPTGVATARDELFADFEDALVLKLQHCTYGPSEGGSLQWVAMPETYRRDPYLSEAEQRRSATEWLATEWAADGPFPKRYSWEFRLVARGRDDGNAPGAAVYSWDPESQRLSLGISFAFPAEFEADVEPEIKLLPDEIAGPSYPEDHPPHTPRIFCSWDECHVTLSPGLDVRTARRLSILDGELPVTLRLEVAVEPAGDLGDGASSGNGPRTVGRPTWGCWMTVADVHVRAWGVLIDGRRYAGS